MVGVDAQECLGHVQVIQGTFSFLTPCFIAMWSGVALFGTVLVWINKIVTKGVIYENI